MEGANNWLGATKEMKANLNLSVFVKKHFDFFYYIFTDIVWWQHAISSEKDRSQQWCGGPVCSVSSRKMESGP